MRARGLGALYLILKSLSGGEWSRASQWTLERLFPKEYGVVIGVETSRTHNARACELAVQKTSEPNHCEMCAGTKLCVVRGSESQTAALKRGHDESLSIMADDKTEAPPPKSPRARGNGATKTPCAGETASGPPRSHPREPTRKRDSNGT